MRIWQKGCRAGAQPGTLNMAADVAHQSFPSLAKSSAVFGWRMRGGHRQARRARGRSAGRLNGETRWATTPC